MKRLNRILCCLAVLVFGLCVFTIGARAEAKKTVRFGMYNKDNYHIIDDHSRHSGYDNEYLLEIAKYTGWEYESLEGTWQECIHRLERGEIDLLGGVGKNDEWTDILYYAEEPSAYASNCLLIKEDSDAYTYEDFRAFDGIRVGILMDSTVGNDLASYAEDNGFSYSLHPYETEKDLNEAMERGEIDCLGLSDFRNLSMYKIIARIGDEPLYYVVSAKRPDLKEELDMAITEIHKQNRFYEAQLYDKYFNSAHTIAFSREEMEYIEKNPVIQAAIFPDIPQVSQFDSQTGVEEGIIFHIFDEISEKTGMSFSYTEVPEDQLPWDFLYENPNVILAPLFQNNLIHYSERMRFSDAIIPGNMISVTNKKTVSEVVHMSSGFRLAIPKGMFGASEELKELFPTCNLVLCESHEDGLNMVWKGKADMTIVNELLGSYLLQSPYYRELDTGYLNQVMENVTIGMGSSSDVILMSIINKVIQSMSQSDIQQMVTEYAASHPYQKSLREEIYENWKSLCAVLLAALTVIIIWGVYVRQRKIWQEEKLQLKVAEEKLKTEEKYKKELFQRANFDDLTGLYSQRYFYERADALEEEHPEKTYAYFIINICNFKLINEIYGMERGNLLLIEGAKKLRELVGEQGLTGRLYADQFVCCYPMNGDIGKKLPAYQTLFYFHCDGMEIRVQTKVGLYFNKGRQVNAAQAITYARVALQNHEEKKKNQIYMYQKEYMDRMLRNQMLTNEMEDALKQGQFQVYLQPQYNIKTKQVAGAEALVRWVHPKRGMIGPNEFIPVFEMNGFITQLDLFMLDSVCRLLAEWKREGKLLPVSVNLSRVDLRESDICRMILNMVRKYGVSPKYLHLEITESAYVKDDGERYEIIEALRKEGFIIEMDDFGSGYSSLNMLKELPVDVIKLDMKFCSEEKNMERGGSIIESIVNLAHKLGILVIAEGVETEREANFLLSIHCLIAQGYLYGRPLPVSQFQTLLDSGPIGTKMRKLPEEYDNLEENLYWEVEGFNRILCQSGKILFDYDPKTDLAHIIWGREEGQLKTIDVKGFLKNLSSNPVIAPDSRNIVYQALTEKEPNPVSIRIQAAENFQDRFWYEATVYHYCSEGALNRVILIMEREKTEG